MLPPGAETGTGVTVDVGVVVGVSVDHAQKPGPAQPTKDALGVWQIALFALPLLMTGEKVRDIGVGAGVGQWAQQEVNGVRDLEGQVGVIAARSDGRLRHGRR